MIGSRLIGTPRDPSESARKLAGLPFPILGTRRLRERFLIFGHRSEVSNSHKIGLASSARPMSVPRERKK